MPCQAMTIDDALGDGQRCQPRRIEVERPTHKIFAKHAFRHLRYRVMTFGVGSVVAVVMTTSSLLATYALGPVHSREAARQVSAVAALAPGTRLVGIGHATVTVPATWGTNQFRCTSPQADTVVIDVASLNLCATTRPAGVESVELRRGKPYEHFDSPQPIDIDGTPALRQPTSCTGPTYCFGTVYLPTHDVTFHADSGTGRLQVDQVLDTIRVIPSLVAVPGWQVRTVFAGHNGPQRYLEALDGAGLYGLVARAPTLFGGGPRLPDDRIYNVAPETGTMLLPGQTVIVTVTAPAILNRPPPP